MVAISNGYTIMVAMLSNTAVDRTGARASAVDAPPAWPAALPHGAGVRNWLGSDLGGPGHHQPSV